MVGRKRINTEPWFWGMVDRGGEGCWPWRGHIDRGGYGRTWFNGRTWWVHRLALHLSGVSLGLLDVCHRCDNPPCCRPDHLFLGTAKDNAADMMAKGRRRGPHGESHHRAKLNTDDVAWIRSLGGLASLRVLAHGFGVSKATVGAILRGETWKECA